MAHPAQHAIEAARKRRTHPAGIVEGKQAAVKRLDRKGGGAVDVSSWRPPVAHDVQPLNQEVIETSLDKRKGIADAKGDIPERKKYARGGRLTAGERQSLPKSDFALPGRGTGPKGAGSGSYPIENESHARNALARSSGKPVEAAVRARVHAKYPDIGEG